MASIAGNLKGWALSIGSSENDPEIESWLFSRVTPDSKRLALVVNPSKRFVRFVERSNHDIAFNIICSGIEHVDIGEDELTFRGKFHYKIWHDGMFHEISLEFNSPSIVDRSYDFDPPKP